MSIALGKRSTIRLMRDFEAMDRTSCECEDYCGCGSRRCQIIDVLAQRIKVPGEALYEVYCEQGTSEMLGVVRRAIPHLPPQHKSD